MTDQLSISDSGDIVSQPLTWDGEPLYSQSTVREGLFDPEAFEQMPGQIAMSTDEPPEEFCVICEQSLDDHWLGSCPDQAPAEDMRDRGENLSIDCGARELAAAQRAGHSLPTYAEALKLASDEYGWRRSEFDGAIMLLSRGADGGMHYRGDAYSVAAARGWAAENARTYARRIAAGEVTGTLLFWGGSGWYLG